ncbi:MAG: glycosyltransferase [Burkholderiales bacterium]|nr:MAG: glycosyltransferase [Burkholderiales bacterium]
MSIEPDSLLIYAPVPLFKGSDGYLLEDQACNGLRLWSRHFSKLIVMHPVEAGEPPASWIPLEQSGIDFAKVEIIPLPTAYRPDQFAKHYLRTRNVIRKAISRSQYVAFAIGGLFGDWGSVGAWQAHRMGRKFAIWTDRVESEVVRHDASAAKKWRHRLRARLTYRPMQWLERFLLRRCTVGLFHGAETYATYAPYAKSAEIVHDIHLKKSDRIPAHDLQSKKAAVQSGPLKICYVGRADAMKGPLDWIEALRVLHEADVRFEAHWLGDGEMLETMRQEVSRLALEHHVHLHGFVRDRQRVLDQLRSAHLFVFCHKTPESPRNLIEALSAATPIVGYDGAYARDLISAHHGGVLTPIHQPNDLAAAITHLAHDRTKLTDLMERAYQDSEPFNDESVFEHRCMLIRQYMG